ncbi:MAG: insulinase family protein [Alphaproteobacteria bacterium]|nr:insulinase family protein [Alphaproteobacteria bacterium]
MKQTLDNGLRVVHQPGESALAALYLWFEVGTVDETPDVAGAAHLLEHMLFKGTATRGVGVCAAEIEAMGGDLNAYTTWDQTVLHATVLAEHWEQALEVLADMAWASAIDPDELDREKPVVIEEIRGYDDEPESVLDDHVTARLFPGHPYGRPVLGTAESVAGMDRDALIAFWRRHYTTDRCVLGVSGPMSEDAVREAAARLTRAAPRGPAREPVPPAPAPEVGAQRLERDFETPLVSIAWVVPGDGHPDVAAYEVLANALGAGRASLLQSELRIGLGLVADAWCTTYARRSTGSLEIGLAPLPDRTDEAVAATLSLVRAAGDGLLASVEVDRARKNVLAELLYSAETVDGVAHDLAWFTARRGGPEAREDWRAAVAAVEAADVQRLVRSLGEPTITVLDPKAAAVAPGIAELGEPDLHGVDVRFSGPDDGWEAQGPLAAVYLVLPGGRLLETHERAGLVGMWASLVTSGAGDLDNTAFAAALDALQASVSAIAGRNTMGVQLSVPVANLVPALDLVRSMLLEPRFDRDELDRLTMEYLLDLDTLLDRPDDVCNRKVWARTWAGHPWGWTVNRGSLGRITTRAIRAFHEQWVTRTHLKVAIAGDVSRNVALRALSPLLQGLPEGPAIPPRAEPAPIAPTASLLHAGHEAAIVTLATRTPAVGGPHDPGLRMAGSILSAQSGRLFMSLRERDSLAYSVWSRTWEGFDGGMLTLGVATDPARATEAKNRLLDELHALRDDGPTDEELARNRAMSLGQFAMGQQRAGGRAVHLGLCAIYDRSPHIAALREELDGTTAQSVKDALGALDEPLAVVVRPR